MEVKVGYKKTEVGMIPEDWDVLSLGEICRMKSGESITSANIDEFSKYPCYGGNGLRGFTGKFTHDGQYALIGRQGALCGNVVGVEGKFFASEHAVVVTPFEKTDIHWLTYMLGDMRLNQYSESSAQPGLSVSKLLRLNIAFPPSKTEQHTIAATLSNIDSLLTSLDELIAKKRLMKVGAMQELLTGRKRLPGFTDRWEEKTFGEIGVTDPENLTSKTDPDYSFKYISLEDVDVGVLKNYSEIKFRFAPSRARRIVRKNDILISTVRPNLKSHLFIREDATDLVCSTGFSVLRCNPNLANPAYVFFHLFAHQIEQQIETLLTGSNYPAINSKDVKALQIYLPTIKEQTGIAEILSDMDAEIATLEARREKTSLLKQGMMQELLTGRTRLV
jgi:type I restriction enzyme S subunit